jgi:hypothetical protein
LESAVAQLQAAVSALREADLVGATSVELTAALAALETESIRLGSANRRVIAEVDRRGVAGEYGASKTADLLRQLLLITARDASARVAQARDYGPRIALTGEPLEPVLPIPARALEAGTISLAHAHVIRALVTALPDHIELEHGVAAQHFLVEQARHLNPTQLAHAAIRLRDTLNPDGRASSEADQQRRREFRLTVHPDGSSTPGGHFTPELTAAIRPVLDSLAAPAPAENGTPDSRTPGQRRHDAVLDAAMRLLRSGTLPDCGGAPVTILLTMTEAQAAARSGIVTDSYNTPLAMGTALRLAAEAEIIPIVLDVHGAVLSMGRSRRLATVVQRRALAVRDSGCSFPGCTAHAAWCEVHHIVEWLRGGGTDLGNLTMLCSYHHRHFESQGWSVRIAADGLPDWTPPEWLDPKRRPRRNAAHGCGRQPEWV